MEAKIEKGNLIITLPVGEPTPSSTGKTLLVASSHGAQATTATAKGNGGTPYPVRVSVNAYIPAD